MACHVSAASGAIEQPQRQQEAQRDQPGLAGKWQLLHAVRQRPQEAVDGGAAPARPARSWNV